LSDPRPFRNAPIRRRRPQRTPDRPGRPNWRKRLILAVPVLIAGLFGCGAVARLVVPSSNTALTRFDVIIVLGNPADSDGNPTPTQLARVTEGVHEYERGVAPRLILTGGAVYNQYVEARVMARTAMAQGIPEAAIFIEPEARNTVENLCYAARIMREHGWRSAEVVSSGYHLPRAALILGNLGLEWRTHAAPPVEPESAAYQWTAGTVEVLKTVRYMVWARWTERCEP
jgi:uncharacterized SAM-binding protein YcdF (DUF218 family)